MQVDYTKIPHEMRAYKQWCVWQYEDHGAKKPTKVPYHPLTGYKVSVTDPSTWSSFDDCLHNVGKYNGIGFILSKNDPYTFIDLDDCEGNQEHIDRQLKIYQQFDSYSERSPSGNGLHIIVKGYVPNGRRRSHVELYSDERYMTMTGVVFNDKPIMERQTITHVLWTEMGGVADAQHNSVNQPQREEDVTVVTRALDAANGVKFKELLEGRWQQYYSSQSEADLAFINIIAFYTQNREQIVRIFRASALGQRDKAQRQAYVGYMLQKCFDNLLPPIDFDGLVNAWNDAKDKDAKAALHSDALGPLANLRKLWTPTTITPPMGLLGEMAQFIYQAAVRPVPEMAICGAIGLLAGICGRPYNISGTGLNQYVLLLAPTGTGKEAMAGGIEKLLNALKFQIPSAGQFRGPSEIASGQALLKHFAKNNPCFVSIVGEFGLKMRQLADPRASSSEIMLKKVLLDLYNKSGHDAVLGMGIVADANNSTPEVRSPAFSLLGESTPETFYDALDVGLIADGLLPRCMILEYTGDRPPRNELHEAVKPSEQLVSKLAELAHYSMTLQEAKKVINVEIAPEAKKFLDQLDKEVDTVINSTKTDALRHLWNRAHVKTLKLAALVAVGCNYTKPAITLEIAQWAYNVISIDIMGMVTRFSRGEIGRGGNNEDRQAVIALNACTEYLSRDAIELESYDCPRALHMDKVIPYMYLSRKLLPNQAFKNDRMGATNALKRVIQTLVDCGDLQEVPRATMAERYVFKGRAFVMSGMRKPAAKI